MDEYRDHCDVEYLEKRDRGLAYLVLCAALAVIGVIFGFAAFAQAQQADPLQSLSMDWQALATAQGHVATGIQAIAADVAATKKKLADTDAYWKAWCGDKPGCVPIPVPDPK